jgi:hypothetical protein
MVSWAVLSCIGSVALIELIDESFEVESPDVAWFPELQAINMAINPADNNKICFFISDELYKEQSATPHKSFTFQVYYLKTGVNHAMIRYLSGDTN